MAVKIDPACAADVQSGESRRPEVSELLKVARSAGIQLVPMHPGTTDPELRTWFAAEVGGDSDPDTITSLLMKHGPVLAAYPKPPDELP